MANPDLQLLIFDLDGVVTSEQKYWNTARLTVWELLTQLPYVGLADYFGADLTTPEQVLGVAERVIDTAFITELKNRAVNSNWDLTFFVVCLHLIGILQQVPLALTPDRSLAEQLTAIRQAVAGQNINLAQSQEAIREFWAATTQLKGTAVQDYVAVFAERVLGHKVEIFSPALWTLCYDNFQDWYEAKKGYQLPDDETVLAVEQIRHTLEVLSQRYTLGIATGRPRNETINPLTALGLLPYFDPSRVVTYDEVLAAESSHREPLKLGKPHPFIVLQAIYPHLSLPEILAKASQTHPQVAYIGDAASDVVAARAAGCLSIGVLTGFGNDLVYKEQLLSSMGCGVILPSILALPEFLFSTP